MPIIKFREEIRNVCVFNAGFDAEAHRSDRSIRDCACGFAYDDTDL